MLLICVQIATHSHPPHPPVPTPPLNNLVSIIMCHACRKPGGEATLHVCSTASIIMCVCSRMYIVHACIDLVDYVSGIGNGITWVHSNNSLNASRSVHSVSRFHHNCLRKTTFKSPSKNLLSSEWCKFYVFSSHECYIVGTMYACFIAYKQNF